MSRTKGACYERELVNTLKERDLKAQRVPLSGATEKNTANRCLTGQGMALSPWPARQARSQTASRNL